MYSSQDLERFYFEYQSEWMPCEISIQAYCSKNNVPYKIMDRLVPGISSSALSMLKKGLKGIEESEAFQNYRYPSFLSEDDVGINQLNPQ